MFSHIKPLLISVSTVGIWLSDVNIVLGTFSVLGGLVYVWIKVYKEFKKD